ncbi:16S rRNA m(2)G 1207 methyltransferase [Bisgaardia hudsonensis]|uniref:Ribosomal RNA small subunit methyltransferase C n=1 Tax=Bisgaardia hudsonensis TaxID=109472 RepID=A0A4R2N339_9PAST|nr:16S rRNA (guanine(1207)-N(2))-methyltransferase RsmC [Bisgaardia hudsonensis]QLB12747.1 16S rRNA (guanine(1207)-N(2))-methyltransferase [Bisgaardia hudsonensis]TCP14298.1 16S rRNA m(2)G 1207 methyltransferase [Bisgaardia hudsonensis]
MISLESEVLERHLEIFHHKSILFAGGINDDFPKKIQKISTAVSVWSWYFDYVKRVTSSVEVDFSAICTKKADMLVYYWTKNKQEVNFQLMQLLANADESQEMLIIGENRSGVRSVEKLLAPYGDIAKIDSARRCGLYHFSLKKRPHFNQDKFWHNYTFSKLDNLTLWGLPGAFSANELDVGTDLLLSTVDKHIRGDVLDLGCGVGVIGSYIQKLNPRANVTMTDIHCMALESAKKTLAENQLSAKVLASDVFSDVEGKFDLLISNPPFHSGVDTDYRAVNELIQQAKWYLKDGGELRIVANAFLPYPDLLDTHFGSHEVLAKTNKFKVYSVRS